MARKAKPSSCLIIRALRVVFAQDLCKKENGRESEREYQLMILDSIASN